MGTMIFDIYDSDKDRVLDPDMRGVRRLAAAIRIRCILDARGEVTGTTTNKDSKLLLINRAKMWILDNRRDESVPGSFLWCCWALDAIPGYVRRKIKMLPSTDNLKGFLAYDHKGTRLSSKFCKRVRKPKPFSKASPDTQ